MKTGSETSCLTGRVLLPAVFIFAVLRHRRVIKQDEAGVARNDGRLAGRCRVTAWEVLKFHSVTAFDTIAAARLQTELQTELRLFCVLRQPEDRKEFM
ncbi:hypothetical protein PHYPO_G00158030 [Pangasianodon hypophthalmus]|uniref:Uncharacterized protein n=1 Tax=Pangasianodon hypophthalmus TaxID=310915 RepID=A0A5N5JXJ7_PANHP|nr:hypothetical protein PHYPO_G00158030 [Pangasianodon hypophthalmus]